MDEYKVHFDLLVPKFILFRLDVLPFLIAYSLLVYCFLTFEDAGNTYIYMRLTFVALGFINCTFWANFRSYIHFWPLVQESTSSYSVQQN